MIDHRAQAADDLSLRNPAIRAAAGAVLRNIRPLRGERGMPYTTYEKFSAGFGALLDMREAGVTSPRVNDAIDDVLHEVRGRTRNEVEAENAFSWSRWAIRLDEALDRSAMQPMFKKRGAKC